MDIENAKRHFSELQEERRKHKITLPLALKSASHIEEEENSVIIDHLKEELKKYFPHSINKPIIKITSLLNNSNKPDDLENKFLQTSSTAISTDISTYNYTGSSVVNEMVNIVKSDKHMHIGILFSGIQAPGIHNIICGVLDSLKKKNKKNILYGFLNGFEGLKKFNVMELKNEYVSMFRNIGGFDMMKSSSLNIESEKDKKRCFKISRHLNLKGLIIIGGVEENTQIAELAEYFEHVHSLIAEKYKLKKKTNKENKTNGMKQMNSINLVDLSNIEKTNEENTKKNNEFHEKETINFQKEQEESESDELREISYEVISDLSDEETKKAIPKLKFVPKKYCKTSIISIPKSIYGEFSNEYFESSLGFDTTVFAYCFYISYLMAHTQTYLEGYHFIKILGNVSSHIALECFLQTKPNIVLIGEEIKKKKWKISDIINFLTETIQIRYQKEKKKYGIILIPEGLLKHVIEFKQLIKELLNIKCTHYNEEKESISDSISVMKELIKSHLTKSLSELFFYFPDFFQNEILKEIIQNERFCYSHLSVEQLLVHLTQEQVKLKHKINDLYFASHFYGNECTCSLPTNFDSAYGYILGFSCPDFIEKEYNGYICSIKNVKHILFDINRARIWGYPICNFINVKEKKHALDKKKKLYIKKKKVDLTSDYFEKYKKYRKEYLYTDRYRVLSGIQYLEAPTRENIEILGSPKKRNSFLNSDFKSFDIIHNNICNKINFTISELKKDFLEVKENVETEQNKENGIDTEKAKKEGKTEEEQNEKEKEKKTEEADIMCYNFIKTNENLSEVEKMLSKSVIKFNTILIRHNTKISFLNTNFESKLNFNVFSNIQNIKEFYTAQENALTNVQTNIQTNVQANRTRLGSSIKNIGVVLLSHSVPSSNNILVGLHQRLSIHNFKLIGFTKGIKGLLNNQFCFINDNNLKNIVNIGGFPLLGIGFECEWKDIVTEVEKEEENINVKEEKKEDIVTEEKKKDIVTEEKKEDIVTEEKKEDIVTEEKKEDIVTEEKKEDIVTEEKKEDIVTEEKKEKNNIHKKDELKKKNVNNKKEGIITICDLIKEEHIRRIIRSCQYHDIHNLVFIGDEKVISLMNILNDYFLKKNIDIKIITVPVSLYNSFNKHLVECSVGYHSMVKNISNIISNLQSDCLNSGNYYYIVKVHTNINSSLILSIQLETHCNICLVGEGIASHMISLHTLIENVTLIIIERINRMKNYGVILFSSNLIYCINDFFELSKDIDEHVKKKEELTEIIESASIPKKFESVLKKESIELLEICTQSVKEKVLRKEKRENEEVDSDIEVMLINEVRKYLKKLTEASKENEATNTIGCYNYKKHMNNLTGPININNIKIYKDIDYLSGFQTIIKNIDKEINCAMPTHFDNSLAYSHGLLAGLAVENDLINYVTSIRHLNLNRIHWGSSLYPGYCFINNKNTTGPFPKYPYVAPIPTSMKSSQMATVKHTAASWAYSDSYIYVGPVQHAADSENFGSYYF